MGKVWIKTACGMPLYETPFDRVEDFDAALDAHIKKDKASRRKRSSKGAVARPLHVLAPLIHDDLEEGRKAAEQAAMPHYKAAGEKLLEAKAQIPHGEFGPWLKRNFKLSDRQARTYMALAKQNGSAIPFSSLSEFKRETSKPRSLETNEIRERQARAIQEAKAIENRHAACRKLALKLIAAGYKAIATELHPDKGGSTDDMALLNFVRDELKERARYFPPKAGA